MIYKRFINYLSSTLLALFLKNQSINIMERSFYNIDIA